MKVGFRVDASSEIGSGHIMRCLVLAKALKKRGFDCIFICRKHDGNLIEVIKSSKFTVLELNLTEFSIPFSDRYTYEMWMGANHHTDALETIKLLENEILEWLVVDHYGIDFRWEQIISEKVKRIFVIDDLADRKHFCNALLDQGWHSEDTQKRYCSLILKKNCMTFLGPKYALLGEEYSAIKKNSFFRRRKKKRILVYMGATDFFDITCKAIEALTHEEFYNFQVEIVAGVNYRNLSTLKQYVSRRPNTVLHEFLPSIATLMSNADLIIGAGGVTNWERLYFGVPSIVISVADNQRKVNLNLAKDGFIYYLGHAEQIKATDIRSAVRQMINNKDLLQSMRKKGSDLVSGNGANIVADYFFGENNILCH